jgi:DNA-binding NarL/FixJ family response regulator
MKINNEKEIKNLDEKVEKILKTETSKSNKIKELFNLGLEIKDIAALLNIRYNFAYNVISNYIIINDIEIIKEEKESKKDKVIELHKKGKTNIEISKELKTNYNYIYKIIKEFKSLNENKENIK